MTPLNNSRLVLVGALDFSIHNGVLFDSLQQSAEQDFNKQDF